ncbi:hypothetical protein KS874_004661 [Vibrio parahaemolyticus]|nr:hypothetical protein [Vibrio parahaemolyticus]
MKLAKYFLGMMFSAGLLFVIGVTVVPFFAEGVPLVFSADNNFTWDKRSLGAVYELVLAIIFTGFCWSAAWLAFKGCEKKFLELWFNKKT